MINTMLRLVTGFLDVALISLCEISHTNLSSSILHFIPRALCVNSCSSSKVTTVSFLSGRLWYSIYNSSVVTAPFCHTKTSLVELFTIIVCQGDSICCCFSRLHGIVNAHIPVDNICNFCILLFLHHCCFPQTEVHHTWWRMRFTIRYSTSSADKSPPGPPQKS